MPRFPYFWLVVGPVLATEAGAQSSPCAAILDSTRRANTLSVQVGFSIPRVPEIPQDLHRDYLLLGESIARHFVAPTPVSLPLWPGTYSASAHRWIEPGYVVDLGLEGYLGFRVSATGRVRNVVFTNPWGLPGLEHALLAAVHRADSAGVLFAPSGNQGGGQDTTVVLFVEARMVPGLGFAPFMRLRLSAIPVLGGPIMKHIPAPRYPLESFERTPIGSGSAIVLYVIDESGRVDKNTARAIYADHLKFATSAIEAVERGTFVPARVGECGVRFLVSQRITFKVQD